MRGSYSGGILLLLVLQLLFVSRAGAAPGALDGTFNGIGTHVFRGQAYANDAARGVAVQPDGKVIVVGYVDNVSDTDILVTRYNSDGTLDTTFASDGMVTYDSGYDDKGAAVAIQADGKIVVCGYSYNGADDDAIVVRFTSTGALDSAFGTEGVATYYSWNSSETFNAVAVQGDGKIVVAGRIHDIADNEDALIIRYNADGTLDDTFAFNIGLGAGGVITQDIFPSRYDSATAVALQDDGKIVVAGHTLLGPTYDILLLRYNADGSADGSFGSGGRVLYDGGVTAEDYATGVAVDADGKIVVAGYSNAATNDVILLRFAADGTVDPAFGTAGLARYDSGRADYARAVTLQGDGKIVVAGSSHNGTDEDFLILRFASNGSLDPGFGNGGRLGYDSGGSDTAYAVAMQGDGKIVAAGHAQSSTGLNQLLLRASVGGVRDAAFDTDGVAILDSKYSTYDYANAVAVQADGKIVVAGDRLGDALLLRFLPDGTLDPDFGTEGVVTYDSGGNDAGYGVTIQSDGKILVTGNALNGPNNDLLVLRYNGDGTLDSSFGTGGAVTTDYGGDETGWAVAIQGDGKIVVSAASTSFMGAAQVLLLRFHEDGTPDTAFGTAGVVAKDGEGLDILGYTVSIGAEGKIVVGGYWGSKVMILQFLADGSPDTGFGTDGAFSPDRGRYESGSASAIQPDGKILLTGYSQNADTGKYDMIALRVDSTGSLDPSFGTAGITTYGEAGHQYPYWLGIQPDGRILVTGASYNADNTNEDIFLVRLDASGQFDDTFGTSGRVVWDSGQDDAGMALTVQADGRIVIAGTTYGTDDDDIVVLRYMGGDFPLSVIKAAGVGTVTDEDGLIQCGNDCSENYAIIKEVVLTATAGTGYSFSSWSGCDSTGGNRCTVATSRALTVSVTFADNTNPVLAVSDPAEDLIIDNQTYTIRGTASDTAGSVSVTVSFNGQTFTPAVVNGAFEQAVPLDAETSYTITATARDEAGNSTTVQRVIRFAKIGDIDGTSGLDITDALLALRYSVGLAIPGTAERNRCDVAPLINGISHPDGVIDIADVMLILRKVVGLGW